MQELLQSTALRVLSCYKAVPPAPPDLSDVQRLRDAVYGLRRRWQADALAAYILEREKKLLEAKAATR